MADDDEGFAVVSGAAATVALCGVLAVGCARRNAALCAWLWTAALLAVLAGPLIDILTPHSRAGGMGLAVAILLAAQAFTFGRGALGRNVLNAFGVAAALMAPVGGAIGDYMLATRAPPDVFARAPIAASACFWGLHLIWRGLTGPFLARRAPPAGSRPPA